MLLHDMITAEPVEIVPVAHLVFHFGLAFLAGIDPEISLVPVHLSADYLSDFSIVDAVEQFAVTPLIMALESYDDIEFGGLGCGGCGQYPLDTGRIDGHRFFHEDMFAL